MKHQDIIVVHLLIAWIQVEQTMNECTISVAVSLWRMVSEPACYICSCQWPACYTSSCHWTCILHVRLSLNLHATRPIVSEPACYTSSCQWTCMLHVRLSVKPACYPWIYQCTCILHGEWSVYMYTTWRVVSVHFTCVEWSGDLFVTCVEWHG